MTRRLWLAVVTVALVVAGCSAPADSADAEPLVIDVRIAEGVVTPTNASLRAGTGQPIVLLVDSDAVDELHVHSNPEHTFVVEPIVGQRFEFTVDVPGRVDVEAHQVDRTIATIAVGGA